MRPEDALLTRPQTVALLGLGASRMAYTEQVCHTNCGQRWEEVWTVNFGGCIYRHDKLWIMDDMKRQATAMPGYGQMMAIHDKPIITSVPYPEFPMAVRFPVEEVVTKIGDDFLNSTVAYAIAWAMITGVKELWLYGCDFHYPNETRKEEGGQCAAYLLGLARHFGMTFKLPQMTTLLGAYQAKNVEDKVYRPLYGYETHPFIKEVSADGSRAGESAGESVGSAERPSISESSEHTEHVPIGSDPSRHPGETGG